MCLCRNVYICISPTFPYWDSLCIPPQQKGTPPFLKERGDHIHVYMDMLTDTHIYIYMHMYTCVYIHIYVCPCRHKPTLHIYIHMYVYVEMSLQTIPYIVLDKKRGIPLSSRKGRTT